MSVLMEKAYSLLSPSAKRAAEEMQLYDVLYADDTMLLGTSCCHVEELAAAIETVGAEFGMSLHWGKTQALGINTERPLRAPSGEAIEDKGALVYLGALISSDGLADSEISRRLGMAVGDYQGLQKMWSHAGVSRSRKLHLFRALIESKLQYGLVSLWLGTAQRWRIDGFHARCLRRILKIPPSYHSRISNKSVFEQARALPISEQVLKRQMLLLGKTARTDARDPLRANVFVGSTLQTQVGRFVRRVGRPRLEWTTELLKLEYQRSGSAARIGNLLQETGEQAEMNWKDAVDQMFSR